MTLQSRLWITQVHWKWHHSKAWNRDFFIPPLHSTPSLRGSPSEYRHKVWYVITRMVRLPEGDKSLRIRLLVLTESTNVADGRTDRRTDTARWHCLRLCIASRGKNYRATAADKFLMLPTSAVFRHRFALLGARHVCVDYGIQY